MRRNKATTRATLKAGGMRAPALPVRGCGCGGPRVPHTSARKKRGRGRPPKDEPACSICAGTGILPWHHLTRAWWSRLWASPMASQFIESDVDALYELAALKDSFWHSGGMDGKLAGEVRQRAAQFGSTPLDRRRLEWGLEQPPDEGDEAPPPQPEKPREDPRNVLRMVKPA